MAPLEAPLAVPKKGPASAARKLPPPPPVPAKEEVEEDRKTLRSEGKNLKKKKKRKSVLEQRLKAHLYIDLPNRRCHPDLAKTLKRAK